MWAKICVKYELEVSENQFEAKTRARARGERINGRFKNFCVLADRYRHKISMHSKYMHSQNTKFGDSLVFHISRSIGPFYLSQTILERGESQLQIMSCGPKTISTL